MIQFEGVCLVANMPISIKRDSQNRLHAENGPAIEWADGYKLYFYHGVAVPEKWILHPEKLTKEDWSNESNLEKRK
jgi:internalin A